MHSHAAAGSGQGPAASGPLSANGAPRAAARYAPLVSVEDAGAAQQATPRSQGLHGGARPARPLSAGAQEWRAGVGANGQGPCVGGGGPQAPGAASDTRQQVRILLLDQPFYGFVD